MVPFLFCIIGVFNKGVEAGEAQSISGYDGSSPKNSEIWDMAIRCKEQAERKLEEERGQVQLRDVKEMFARFSDNGRKGKRRRKMNLTISRN